MMSRSLRGCLFLGPSLHSPRPCQRTVWRGSCRASHKTGKPPPLPAHSLLQIDLRVEGGFPESVSSRSTAESEISRFIRECRSVTLCKEMTENLIYSFYLWYNTRQKLRVNMARLYKTFYFRSDALLMRMVCDSLDLVKSGQMSVHRAKRLAVCL